MKISLTTIFLIAFLIPAIGQVNPIVNLYWESQYDFGDYHMTLSWEEPLEPHDELIGYNVYRDDEIYAFQTEKYVSNMFANPNCGQEFMYFESDGDGFVIHVTAVYAGQIESDYTETAFAYNNLLKTGNLVDEKQLIYPNPSSGVVNIGIENLTEIIIYDNSGKEIDKFKPQQQIDLSSHTKGIYLIKMVSEKGEVTRKIILK